MVDRGYLIPAPFPDMNVQIEQNENQYRVAPAGRLDTNSAPQFQEALEPLMQAVQAHVTVDCSGLEYTSSQGLRLFLMLQKSLSKNGGSLVLTDMQPAVKEVFDITGFSNIITIR